MQTQRDKDRVLEGLEGASTVAGHTFDRKKMDEILSGLGNRVFVMNNVHDDKPVVFQTRWALSDLRGPLTREQIQTLMSQQKLIPVPNVVPNPLAPEASVSLSHPTRGHAVPPDRARPVMPPGIPEFFVPRRAQAITGELLQYFPALLGVARLHYADRKAGVDQWETLSLLRRLDHELPPEVWSESEPFDDCVPELDKAPEPGVILLRCLLNWLGSRTMRIGRKT